MSAIKSLSGTNATVLFQGKAKVSGWTLHNYNTTQPIGLMLYDLARLPRVGIDIPVLKIVVPYAASVGTATNFSEASLIEGHNFLVGLAYAIVLGSGGKVADNANTNVGVDDLVGILDWTQRP